MPIFDRVTLSIAEIREMAVYRWEALLPWRSPFKRTCDMSLQRLVLVFVVRTSVNILFWRNEDYMDLVLAVSAPLTFLPSYLVDSMQSDMCMYI